jgi:hypothetical protein
VYFAALAIHSLLRWLSLALGILAVASAVAQGKAARRRVLPFAVSLDLQLVVGLALYLFLSPIVGPGSGAGPGYWSLGHPALALLALGLAHAGSVALRRTAGPRAPGAAALLALAFLALLAAVPWGRPLLRT